MTEELTNGENRKRKAAKSAGTNLWGRWKNRNAKEKVEALVRSIVAATVAGGLAVGTVGYIKANDAQNTISKNQDAWMKDLQGAQEAALLAQNIAAESKATADRAASDALTAKASAEFAKSEAQAAGAKAEEAQGVANGAKFTADTAQRKADQATANAATAASVAATAQSVADKAAADAASTQSFAEETQNELNVLVQNFSDGQAITAQQIDDARAIALAAQSSAGAAQTTADNAQTYANTAQAAADQAKATADKAVADALAAKNIADGAQASADTAQATADNAAQAAADAQTAADAAQATADQAIADAAAAQATADEALAVAQQALSNGPKLTVFPALVAPDNIGVFDDPPTAPITLPAGTYLVTYGANFSHTSGMRLVINGVPNTTTSYTGNVAAGFQTKTITLVLPEESSVAIQFDPASTATFVYTYGTPFINAIKVSV